MTPREICLAAIQAMESDDPSSAAPWLTDDFLWIGTVPKSLDKKQFLSLMIAVKRGLPDYTLNVKLPEQVSDTVLRGTMDPVGTNTGIFSIHGITPIAPTGISVALPRHCIEFTLSGEKIARIKIEHPSGGGVGGLLEHLGVELNEELLSSLFQK